MTKQQFETALQQLTPRRREVLELFLAGESDQAIAQSLYITENTVRQHIRNILKAFKLKNDLDDNHSSQRSNLIALFAQHQPELLQKPVTEAENQRSESVSLSNNSDNKSNNSDNKQDACTTEYDPNFVGREDAIARLNNLIYKHCGTGILPVSPVTRICQIVAPGGQGKTTLARKYLKNNFKTVLEFTIAKETKDIASVESLLEEKLRQLGEEPGREFMVSLDRFKQKLQTQPIGILIDNLEPALKLDNSGQFLPEHRRYLELLRILTDSSLQSLTLITSRERLNEGLDITLYSLPSLTVSAWGEFWQYQGINPDITLLTEIQKAYGGNALAMKVLSNLINNDYQGDMVAYWQDNKTEDNLIVETKVANLIKEQFERLQNINLDAYNLLCRLGCYRYQDVPTVPEAGLICLLWDIAENQHRKIIRILKERALVEFNNSEYWLHPVIRELAIDRLRNSEDWEKANTQAAEFWTESVKSVETLKDALTALEAYYHYLQIDSFELSGKVIVQMRANKWENNEPLGRAFYRLGLLRQIIISINKIINKINPSYTLSRLYNILGDCYWLAGNIIESMECHKQSGIIANQCMHISSETIHIFWLKRLQRYSLFNTGLCKIELWEIEEAINLFEQVVALWENDNFYHNGFYENETLADSWASIAFLKSCLNIHNEAYNFVAKAKNNLLVSDLDSWAKGYVPLFLGLTYKNLKKVKTSFEMYNKAIAYAEESNYPQVKAKALTGLAELYRIKNDIETALNHHQQSIEILEKIGAKCDLAEAYFQLALTYQQMGEQANAQEYFNKAIYLWSPEQIDAPKQIDRVKKAMNYEP